MTHWEYFIQKQEIEIYNIKEKIWRGYHPITKVRCAVKFQEIKNWFYRFYCDMPFQEATND